MYKLKIEAKSGEDLRNQLLALLGETGVTLSTNLAPALTVFTESPKPEEKQPEESTKPEDKQEVPKRIRRTKEQLAADQTAAEQKDLEETTQNFDKPMTPLDEPQDEPEKKEAKPAGSSFTEQDLVKKAIALGVAKKLAIKEVLRSYGAETIPTLEEEHYGEFMEKLETL